MSTRRKHTNNKHSKKKDSKKRKSRHSSASTSKKSATVRSGANFMCRSDYSVELPKPERLLRPKFLNYPFQEDRLLKWCNAQLDSIALPPLPLDISKAVPVNAIDDLAYAKKKSDKTIKLHPSDKALLRKPTDSSGIGMKAGVEAMNISFLKTEKWAGPMSMRRMSGGIVTQIREKEEENDDENIAKESINLTEKIELGFALQHPSRMPVHSSKDNVTAEQIIPIFPKSIQDSEVIEFIHVIGDDDAKLATEGGIIIQKPKISGLYVRGEDGLELKGEYRLERANLGKSDCFLLVDEQNETAYWSSVGHRFHARKKKRINPQD